jgi:hypothetical protein
VLRRIAVCLAFSTWCFLNCWAQLAEGGSVYYARYHPWETIALPTLCWELVLTVGMLAAWKFLKGSTARFFFLLASSVPILMMAMAAVTVAPATLQPVVTSRFLWPALGLPAVAPVVFAVRRPAAASNLLQAIFLYSWPVLAVTYIDAARTSLVRYRPVDYADGPLAARLASPKSGVRVVWIIFDEWSQAITFGKRPEDVRLPNFDRFRAESFYATDAQPPGGFTRVSIPSLILGEHAEAAPAAPNNLTIEIPSHRNSASWGTLPNVFDSAREAGFNTALAGWFHPYGRLLNRSLTECYWTAEWLPPGIEEPMQRESLPAAMWNRARLQMAALPLIGRLFGSRDAARGSLERFAYLRDRAFELAADRSMGLVFIHLPIPHPPAIYDRVAGAMTTSRSRGYLDNLALADRTWGELRRKMEDAGVWNDTAVLISSDHSLRPSMWRNQHVWNEEDESIARVNTSAVPFLLKLRGQSSGVVYEKTFDTTISRGLVTAILAGNITDVGDIAPFMEGRPSGLPARTFGGESAQKPRNALGRAFKQIHGRMAQAQ